MNNIAYPATAVSSPVFGEVLSVVVVPVAGLSPLEVSSFDASSFLVSSAAVALTCCPSHVHAFTPFSS